jgi:hypothetical protein
MNRVMYVGLAMRLFAAAASPAYGAPGLATHAWTAGNETATLPWSAPRGHHQPRFVDIPASPIEDNLSVEDARIDRIIRNVCRNC